MKRKLFFAALFILQVIPFFIILFCYRTLPSQIPIHWNFAGTPDGWGGRNSIFMLPVLSVAVCLFFVLLPKISPKRDCYTTFKKSFFYIQFFLVLLFQALFYLTLYTVYHPSFVSPQFFFILFGVFFMVMGNYLPKVQHNYFVGVRTPWTLASSSCWRRTHRFSGFVWVIGGMLLLTIPFFLPVHIRNTFLVVIVCFIGFAPLLYSFYVYRKIPPEHF